MEPARSRGGEGDGQLDQSDEKENIGEECTRMRLGRSGLERAEAGVG